MRIFTYRNKRTARRTLLIVLAAVAVLAALIIGRFIYLQRFLVYSEDGVHLDYTQKLDRTGQTQAAFDPEEFPFETVVQTGAVISPEDALIYKKLNGYYISTDMLLKGVGKVEQALRENEDYNAVVLDVKSSFGNFYYSSLLDGAPKTDAVDVRDVDRLIQKLTENRKLKVYARFPAFSDRNYALTHQTEGLPLASGALWEGENLCYWLNPSSAAVQGYLSAVAIELSQLGFDGVIFGDFYFPDSENIVWNRSISREEAIVEAANVLCDSLHGYGIEVIFETNTLAAAKFADRVVLDIPQAEQVEQTLTAYAEILDTPAAQVLVMTESRDTRYEACSRFRPLLTDVDEE